MARFERRNSALSNGRHSKTTPQLRRRRLGMGLQHRLYHPTRVLKAKLRRLAAKDRADCSAAANARSKGSVQERACASSLSPAAILNGSPIRHNAMLIDH